MMNKKQKYTASVLLLLSILFVVVVGNQWKAVAKESEKDTTFTLSKEEEAYLKTIREGKITLGITEGSQYTLNRQGEAMGTVTPLINFMEYELNLEVDIVQGDFASLYQKLQDGTIDMMHDLSINEDTTKKIYLATPIYTTTLLMISNQEDESSNVKYMNHTHIGVVKDSATIYYAQPYLHSTDKISYYNGTTKLIEALKKQEIDSAIILETSKSTVYDDYELSVVKTFPQVKISNTIGTCNEKYSKLIQIFNRLIVDTDEGEILKQQVEDEKQRYNIEMFRRKEQDIIDAVKKQYGKVLYYGGSGIEMPLSYKEDGIKKGIIPDMFHFFEETTGIDFTEYDYIEQEEEAKDALSCNEIQLAAGIVENANITEDYNFSDDIYQGEYVTVSGIKTGNIAVSDMDDYYWGIQEADSPLFKNSVFDKQLITFQSTQEMLTAVSKEEVRGAIINRGILDYYNIILGLKKYKRCSELSVPCLERIAYNKENEELNLLIDKLIHIYKVTYPSYLEDWSDTKLAYQDEIIDFYFNEIKMKNEMIVIGVCLVVLLVGITAVIIIYSQSYSRISAKLKMLVRSNNKLDIIEVDMSAMTIQSSAGFTKYKRKMPGTKHNVMSLKQLSEYSGYDYVEHYKKIYQLKQELFEIEYSIFIDGERYYIKEIGNKTKKYIVSTIFDVSDKEEEKNVLQQKLEYDPLTGLFNRSAYIEKICTIVERNPEAMGAFAFIDLDQFKSVNDSFGHMAGDEILKAFAESISSLVKNEDTIVFRIAGDEFGAYRGNLQNDQQLQEFFDELHGLSAAAQIEGRYIERSFSCGVALYNRHTVEMKRLIDCADEAMYQCKEGNQKVVIWTDNTA